MREREAHEVSLIEWKKGREREKRERERERDEGGRFISYSCLRSSSQLSPALNKEKKIDSRFFILLSSALHRGNEGEQRTYRKQLPTLFDRGIKRRCRIGVVEYSHLGESGHFLLRFCGSVTAEILRGPGGLLQKTVICKE